MAKTLQHDWVNKDGELCLGHYSTDKCKMCGIGPLSKDLVAEDCPGQMLQKESTPKTIPKETYLLELTQEQAKSFLTIVHAVASINSSNKNPCAYCVMKELEHEEHCIVRHARALAMQFERRDDKRRVGNSERRIMRTGRRTHFLSGRRKW